MQATTTEQVIARLETIIDESLQTGSRHGYFAALYNRVTQHVRAGIQAGLFDDGPRMERFDVAFANRYFDAFDRFRAGEQPSRAWLLAFKAASDPTMSVLQHLALAMNAHIDLDLGIAAARTCPGDDYASLKGDFDRINRVLLSLVPLEESQLGEIAPVIGKLVKLVKAIAQGAADLGIVATRAGAWSFGESLSRLPLTSQVMPIARRDDVVAGAADVLITHDAVLSLLAIDETRDVAHNIRTLAEGEFELPSLR